MDENQLKFRVGVVVVAGAIIAIILITLLGAWPSPFKPRYTVHIRFPQAPGVAVDTPVRKSGIRIGRVSKLELDTESGGVWLTLKIDDKYPITEKETCQISTGSFVTGDAILEFVGTPGGRTISKDGDESLTERDDGTPYGTVEISPFDVVIDLQDEIGATLASLTNAGRRVELLADNVNKIIAPFAESEQPQQQRLKNLIDQTELAVSNFNSVMATITYVLGDRENLAADAQMKERLREALYKTPEVVANVQKSLDDFQTTLGQFGGVAVRADRNLANLEDFTAPLGERGEEISQNLAESIRNVNEIVANVARLSAAINSEDGTIGQLITNPELYNRANRVLSEIEKELRKLEPILNDVRILSDRVSRDPSGVLKGALDRRPIGTGTKFPGYSSESSRTPGRRLRLPFKEITR